MTIGRIVHADAAVPGDGPAIVDAALLLDDAGTILDVGTAADLLPRHAGAPVERVRGVLLPGLVNAHTHLELSGLRAKVQGGAGFVPWLERLVAARVEEQPEDDLAAVEAAVDELDRAGTVAVGDVTNSLVAVRALARRGFAGAVFHEVFGLARDTALSRVDALASQLAAHVGTWPSSDLAYAPAPHTLYTTHADAVRALVGSARALGRRTSLHLAEHGAERAFLASGGGPFAEFASRRVPGGAAGFDVPGTDAVSYAEALGALAPDVLVVHLADARPDELARVAACRATVVLCPRSNLYIEVRLPALLTMLALGISPALGTDSLASNTTLDVLAEARALLERFPSVAPWRYVQMATANGARALARDDLGALAVGKRPGVLLVEGELGAREPAAFAIVSNVSSRRWIARRSPRGTAS